MHLVDHDEADADRAERPHERLLPEPLGCGIQKSCLAGGDRREA
jgi:hypothetical protein